MPLFLAGLLSRDEVVSPTALEEALQRQVLAGGALDSSLLELGATDEERLGLYLARASGLPLAEPEQLGQPDSRLRKLFPLRLADRHGLVPFAQEDRTLKMACAYPADATLLDEMGFLLSQRIEAWIAPEFRVRLAIEKLYGHQASVRMHELARRHAPELLPEQEPIPTEKSHGDPERCEPPEWTAAEALARLQAATTRDEAIEVALRFGRRAFRYVALFGLAGGKAIGWDAVDEKPGAEHRIGQVMQSLADDTVLAMVLRTRGRYLGQIADSEANRRLLERMGRPMPKSAFLQPVEVGNRIVALVWADRGEEIVTSEAAAELMVVVQGLGAALERLVVARKSEVRQKAATQQAQEPQQDETASPPASEASEVEEGVAQAGDPAAEEPPAASSDAAAEPSPVEAPPAPAAPAPAAAANPPAPSAEATEVYLPAPWPGAESPEERATASPAGKAETDRYAKGRSQESPAVNGLVQACKGAEALLHADSDAERAEALARVAASGAIGAEVLTALLPGPVRTDAEGNLAGGVILDALAALGPWAVPALARAASSRSSVVRYWVAVLLANSNDPAGHAALSRLANDADPHVAAIARTKVQPAA